MTYEEAKAKFETLKANPSPRKYYTRDLNRALQAMNARRDGTFAEIKAGEKLSARSICDYDCIYEIEIISRSATMATVKTNEGTVRCKIYEYNGKEYVMPFGQYSMAPSFYAGEVVK